MKVLAPGGLDVVVGRGVRCEALGPADMGEGGVHVVGEPGHQRNGAGTPDRILGHELRIRLT